jgi:hypothetical protein
MTDKKARTRYTTLEHRTIAAHPILRSLFRFATGHRLPAESLPGFLIEKDGDNLLLADGHRLPYGSGSQGNFEDRLDHADLHDQMSQCYSPGFPVDQPGSTKIRDACGMSRSSNAFTVRINLPYSEMSFR